MQYRLQKYYEQMDETPRSIDVVITVYTSDPIHFKGIAAKAKLLSVCP